LLWPATTTAGRERFIDAHRLYDDDGALVEKSGTIKEGDALMREGEEGGELFLLLDGVVDIEVGGELVAEIGPGALLGERALLEGGKRTATVVAKTPVRVAVVSPDAIDDAALPELAATHRREE
jgi:CRP-like cAMP-binding protein